MTVLKRPAKKILWGLSIVLGLFLALFVKLFGVTSLDNAGFSRVFLFELIGTPQAHADVPNDGNDGNNGSSDGNDGDSSGGY